MPVEQVLLLDLLSFPFRAPHPEQPEISVDLDQAFSSRLTFTTGW